MPESNSTPNTSTPEPEYAGLYQGVQESYYLKNQFGDDMVIGGRKVPVPSIDYKFIIKGDGIVNLQQTSLEDNTRVYYNGNYQVIAEDGNLIKLQCELSDGSGSKPTYVLTINKSTGTASCKGNKFEPEFSVSKNGAGTATTSGSSEPVSSGTSMEESNPDGIYSYKDESAELQVIISGNSWTGKTVIITGMGDEYDNAEYERGVVKGNTLYESSGMVEIGNVSNGKLYTSIGGNRVTLTKN